MKHVTLAVLLTLAAFATPALAQDNSNGDNGQQSQQKQHHHHKHKQQGGQQGSGQPGQ